MRRSHFSLLTLVMVSLTAGLLLYLNCRIRTEVLIQIDIRYMIKDGSRVLRAAPLRLDSQGWPWSVVDETYFKERDFLEEHGCKFATIQPGETFDSYMYPDEFLKRWPDAVHVLKYDSQTATNWIPISQKRIAMNVGIALAIVLCVAVITEVLIRRSGRKPAPSPASASILTLTSPPPPSAH